MVDRLCNAALVVCQGDKIRDFFHLRRRFAHGEGDGLCGYVGDIVFGVAAGHRLRERYLKLTA